MKGYPSEGFIKIIAKETRTFKDNLMPPFDSSSLLLLNLDRMAQTYVMESGVRAYLKGSQPLKRLQTDGQTRRR